MRFLFQKLTAWVLFCLLAAGAALAQPAAGDDPSRVFATIDETLKTLAKITGLEPLRKIQYDRINKDGLKKFLEERIQEVVKPEEIRAEELTLKKFGFVPEDFDLKGTTIELMTEQAAAFYDYKKKKLFLLDHAPSMMQQMALVHELAHALADQHFNLEKFLDRAGENDDGALARMAVMEGQATWLMSEQIVQGMGQSLKTSGGLVQMMTKMAGGAAGQFPVFDRAPLYMRESLVFPYTQGMLFQQAVVEKLGDKGFAEVFRRPPNSTQEILHPEKYFARQETPAPKTPELKSERPYRKLAEGTVGEFDHAILLRQYASEEQAAALAPKWRGGRYRLLESKQGERTVLAYASVWESAEAAGEYFRDYRQVLKGKWKAMEVTREDETTLAGRGDDGYFLVRLEGPKVTVLEGMKEAREAR